MASASSGRERGKVERGAGEQHADAEHPRRRRAAQQRLPGAPSSRLPDRAWTENCTGCCGSSRCTWWLTRCTSASRGASPSRRTKLNIASRWRASAVSAQQPVFGIGLELQDRDVARDGLLDRGDQRGPGQGELAHDGFGVARFFLDSFARDRLRRPLGHRQPALGLEPRDLHARVAIALAEPGGDHERQREHHQPRPERPRDRRNVIERNATSANSSVPP